MKNALTYLTRKCPRACEYCAIRNAEGLGTPLKPAQWQEAFLRLKDMGIEFNLILGNETWLLGTNLIEILSGNTIPYALYTTAPPFLFHQFRYRLFNAGIDNFSCGIDYPYTEIAQTIRDEDSKRKSYDAWLAFVWVRKHFPGVDTQGTVTIHRKNYMYLPQLVHELASIGVFIGVNFIHWNIDGKYDFFPPRHEISELLFQPQDMTQLQNVLDAILACPEKLQNPEMLRDTPENLTNMKWHCGGDPYGGPSIDADGSCRVCGYRKGVRTSKFTIFDLPEKEAEWRIAVERDTMDCPGCYWSYPWMYHYWQNKDAKFGQKVFSVHAGKHIPEKQWSKRSYMK